MKTTLVEFTQTVHVDLHVTAHVDPETLEIEGIVITCNDVDVTKSISPEAFALIEEKCIEYAPEIAASDEADQAEYQKELRGSLR